MLSAAGEGFMEVDPVADRDDPVAFAMDMYESVRKVGARDLFQVAQAVPSLVRAGNRRKPIRSISANVWAKPLSMIRPASSSAHVSAISRAAALPSERPMTNRSPASTPCSASIPRAFLNEVRVVDERAEVGVPSLAP